MTDAANYLDRRAARVAALELKHQIVFGYAIGVGLLLLGFVRCYLVINARHALWHAVMWAGVVVLLLTLILPSIWTLPERWFRWLTGKVGHCVFQLLLAVSYYLVITPAGWWLRHQKGSDPIWEWTNSPPEVESWREKTSALITHLGTSKNRRFLLWQPFMVVSFFLKHRMYILVPSVVVLIVLGLILFFVQTSALAPFIYTLF